MYGEQNTFRARLNRVVRELDAALDDATGQVWKMVDTGTRWGRRLTDDISQTLNRAQARARRSAH